MITIIARFADSATLLPLEKSGGVQKIVGIFKYV